MNREDTQTIVAFDKPMLSLRLSAVIYSDESWHSFPVECERECGVWISRDQNLCFLNNVNLKGTHITFRQNAALSQGDLPIEVSGPLLLLGMLTAASL